MWYREVVGDGSRCRTPCVQDGLELPRVAECIRVIVAPCHEREHRDHILGNRGIDAPQVRQIEAAAFPGIPPRQQETGCAAALAGVALSDVYKPLQRGPLSL